MQFFVTFLRFHPGSKATPNLWRQLGRGQRGIRASLNYHRLMSELIITNVY